MTIDNINDPSRLAESRREWHLNSHLHGAYKSGDDWHRAKWAPMAGKAGSTPASSSTAAPLASRATASSPPPAAAPSDPAWTPVSRHAFVTAQGNLTYARALMDGFIRPTKADIERGW